MHIRLYSALTSDGYLIDAKTQQHIYFTADKTQWESFVAEADCVVLDQYYFDHLEAQGHIPEQPFIVVKTDQAHPISTDKRWYTNLDLKQIKRELKIQGYKHVLCMLSGPALEQMLSLKLATEVTMSISTSSTGGVGEMQCIQDRITQMKPTVVEEPTHGIIRYTVALKK